MRRLAVLTLLACSTGLLAPHPPPMPRAGSALNPLVTLLAGGEAAFGPFANPKGADAATAMGRNPNADYIFYDMEHAPFDVGEMRTYMQFLLDPARLARRGRPGSEIARTRPDPGERTGNEPVDDQERARPRAHMGSSRPTSRPPSRR